MRRGGSINSNVDMGNHIAGSFHRQNTGGSISGLFDQEPAKDTRMSTFLENAEAKETIPIIEAEDENPYNDRHASNADAIRMTAKSDVFSYQSPK